MRLADNHNLQAVDKASYYQLLQSKQEKTVLLEISQAIARIDNKVAFLQNLDALLKPLFKHADAGVIFVDKDKNTFTELYALHNQPIPSIEESKWLNNIASDKNRVTLPFQGSLIEYSMNQPPMMGRLDEAQTWGFDAPFLNDGIENGITHFMCAPLQVSGQKFGLFNLLFTEVNAPIAAQLSFFAQLSDIIAVALANLLASEEILAREREKTLLLSISEEMATIRNRQDLMRVVQEKIQPLIGFDDAVVSAFTPDFTHYKHIIVIAPPNRMSHPGSNQLVSEYVPMQGPGEFILKKLWATSLLRLDTRDFKKEFPGHMVFDFLEDAGLVYNLYAKLSSGVEMIGFLSFHFNAKAKIQSTNHHLYKSITEQISIALANILANEEILQRAAEKNLEIASFYIINQLHTISTFADQVDTLKKIAFEINKVVPFDRLVSNTFYNNLHFLSTCFELQKGKDSTFQPLPLPESFTQKDPITLGTEKATKSPMSELFTKAAVYTRQAYEQLCRNYPNPDMARIYYGMKAVMYIPIQIFNKNAGAMIIASTNPNAFTTQHLQLVQHIFNQLSMGIENLLNHENAKKNEKEKTILLEKIKEEEEIKSVLLSINNNLINIQDRTALLLKLAEELSKLILIDSFGLKTIYENKQFSERLFFTRKSDNSFEALTSLPAEMENNMDELDRHELKEPINEPVIYVGENFAHMCHKYPLYRIAKEQNGIQSVLLAPLKSREGRKSLLVIKSKKAYAYHTNELLLLDRILPQLAIVMENFISYDNVKQLKNLLEAENVYLQEEVKTLYNFEEIVGKGEALQEALEKTGIVAKTDTTVLILGETGTGKELFARAIHNLSSRNKKPLIKINCAALPPQLIESELFGHERGAFTGAIDRRIGKFELAHGSTLFLDEIGEMPLELQSKLLRAIQEKEIERLGSNKTIKTDVRLIAATNRDLAAEVEAKRFRSDLFFRLHVFPVTLPPLRDRKEDIPLLVAHFVDKFAKKLGKPLRGISTDALQALSTYHYPGNIRELEHILERSAILSKNSLIKEVYLPKNDKKPAANNIEDYRIKSFEENERDYILHVLKKCKGKVYGTGSAAELLGLPPTTLASKMKKLGIKKEHVAG